MTHEVMAALLDALGFDGTPLEVDLAAFHVPYDDRGRSGVESGTRDAAARGERIGLVAPIGAGKTSVMRFALDQPSSSVAPIWVPVARDGDDVIQDPRRFLAHIIQLTARHAEKAQQLTPDDRDAILAAATDARPLPASARKVAGKVSAKFWVANAEVAADVTRTVSPGPLQRPLAELIDVANDVLEAIGAHGLQPVLVIDDSDAFTRDLDADAHDRRIAAFFGPVLAELAKLRCGMVVAIHDDYDARPSFQQAVRNFGVLQRTIAIPEIVSGQLSRILDRRSVLTTGQPITEVLTRDAVEALAEHNRTEAARNIRQVFTVAHQALADAVGADRDIVDERDIAAAVSKHRS